MKDQVDQDTMAREEHIFDAAVQLSDPAKRSACLDQACEGDTTLRARIEKLLAAANDRFFDVPPAPSSLAASEAPIEPISAASKIVTLDLPSQAPAGRIGRYKVLEKIGEGGCGVVYLAEQEEPVRRRVALKVIKLGMDTKSVITRFEAERQALAMMDHPNIAKVLDAGATDAGRPFFVMELVRGVRITEYCDQHSLSTRERLALFTQVCHAIQHAHQKGIIHRDIKPSNILVTLHDGVPVPKVIDFGIAKATADQRLTDKTLFTALEQFIGTPAYMSPEQAEMSGLDIDTRSDIYSLGVLLYELLTGRTPFDGKELLASGVDEMRKTIREKEPVRPSTKLSQTLVGADVRRLKSPSSGTPSSEEEVRASSRRLLQLKETIALLRGDLDWIVMKCLEKDRTRRYETANGLAKDIERHLSNEPIVARPPSQLYRFQKMVRRNKLAFAAVTAVVLALIGGLGLATIGLHQARVQRDRALTAAAGEEMQRIQANQRAATITRNLYFAEMNLAGRAAADPGGISRIAELTAKWVPEKGAADLRGWEWYYLRSLLHQDVFTLNGHTNVVQSVAWSPDGKRLASGSEDKTIKVWDTTGRQVIHTLRGHANAVLSVSWNPDGKRLASSSRDNTVKVWDVDSGANIQTLSGHGFAVNSVAWSLDGKRLASASDDGMVKVWDADTGQNTRTLLVDTNGVNSVAWSPDGKLLASDTDSRDNTVKIWDVESGRSIYSLPGHSFHVISVAWSPDGQRLASGGWDETVRIWDAHSGMNIHTLRGHHGVVSLVSWSPDGKRLASGSYDNTVAVWDGVAGQVIHILRGHTNWVNSVSWSPDGKLLASASGDNTVKVWDANSQETLTLRGHTNFVPSVAWSPDGNRLASASFDNTVKVWDAADGQETMTLSGHIGRVYSVAWSPDGKRLASGSLDNTVKVWDANRGQMIKTLLGHTYNVLAVVWRPDGKRLASGSGDHSLKIWEANGERAILTLPAHEGGVLAVAWSMDGKRLASGGFDNRVKVWDAERGKVIHTLSEHTSWVLAVAWSQDGKRLASGSWDNTVKVWDADTGQLVKSLSGHTGGVGSVAWSLDGQRLASGSSDHTLKLWDTASGLEVLTLRGHTSSAQSVVWCPDGKRLASGSWDNTIKIWDARKGYAEKLE